MSEAMWIAIITAIALITNTWIKGKIEFNNAIKLMKIKENELNPSSNRPPIPGFWKFSLKTFKTSIPLFVLLIGLFIMDMFIGDFNKLFVVRIALVFSTLITGMILILTAYGLHIIFHHINNISNQIKKTEQFKL